MLVYEDDNNRKVTVPASLQNKQVLITKHIEDLAKLGIKIEEHYRSPQDIE